MLYSRSKMISKTGRFKHMGKGGQKKAKPTRPSRQARWYPAEDEKKPLPRSFKPKRAKLRSSIAPGTVLIVLSGPFRGKRVVFLNQLPSGLLLVTGPFKVNGVPLRRLNQAYVIATSTKVDVSGVSLPEQVQQDSFYVEKKSEKEARRKRERSGEEAFFSQDDVKPQAIPEERKAIQKQVDDQLLGLPEFSDKVFKAYMGSRFSLTRGQYPHDMSF